MLISVGVLGSFSDSVAQGSEKITTSLKCATRYQEPENLYDFKKRVKEYQDNGSWDKTNACVVQEAFKALKKYESMPGKKAIVSDIDDTALNNRPIIFKQDFGYVRDIYRDWEILGQSIAIEPVRALCNYAFTHGFAVFFITGRREDQRTTTENNLRRAGYLGWTHVYFKPMDFEGSSAAEFKRKWRQEIVDQGYTIVVNIGDQKSDLEGEPQALSNFKLSNPAYLIP